MQSFEVRGGKKLNSTADDTGVKYAVVTNPEKSLEKEFDNKNYEG